MTIEGAAVVTGAGQGIGRAIAARLSSAGRRVWCVDIDDSVLHATVGELRAAGGDVHAVLCDVSRPDAIEAAWEQIDADGRAVTGVVNNAGIFPRKAALEMSAEEWSRVLSVNLTGAFFMAQQAARRLTADGLPGVIVSVASGQAYRPMGLGAHYAASKAAVVNLTRALASEWGPLGIRVNVVVPGLVDTAQPRAVMQDADFEAATAAIPLRRIGTPEDVAAAVAFLLSSDASHVTGHALAVNGGAIMI